MLGFLVAINDVSCQVDDAIIDVQNIARRLRQHRREGSDRSAASIILEASLEMRGAMVYATLVILLTVMPIFFISSILIVLQLGFDLAAAGGALVSKFSLTGLCA